MPYPYLRYGVRKLLTGQGITGLAEANLIRMDDLLVPARW